MTTLKKTIIGLTGSIGMGKTTTAKMFSETGIPVWDADAAVHRLYSENADAILKIGKLCPQATRAGVVDRGTLKEWLAVNPDGLQQLEAIVHPEIAKDRKEFLDTNPAQTLLLDIPLLFEADLTCFVDVIVVVTVSAELQKQRVLARKTMTEAQFEAILAKQMPDAEKRKRADFVIETTSLENVRNQVQKILRHLEERSDA